MRHVVNMLKLEMLLIQESKLNEVDDWVIRSLWGSFAGSFEFSSSLGSARGIISIWKEDFFELNFKVVAQRYILLVGEIKSLSFKCGFENVYAPKDGDRVVF
ncbi:hypothetical protein REPUB_Repub17cG0048600 [Reevesia pubescens]